MKEIFHEQLLTKIQENILYLFKNLTESLSNLENGIDMFKWNFCTMQYSLPLAKDQTNLWFHDSECAMRRYQSKSSNIFQNEGTKNLSTSTTQFTHETPVFVILKILKRCLRINKNLKPHKPIYTNNLPHVEVNDTRKYQLFWKNSRF